MKISKLVMFAGAALSVGSVAMAQTADQDRAYASELVSDAAVKTSALGAAPSGLSIGSGVNTMRIGGSVLSRYNLNFRNKNQQFTTGALASNPKGFTHGFNLPRVALNVGGNVGTEGLTYFIGGAFSDFNSGSTSGGSSTGNFALEDAFIDYSYGNGFSVRFGQFKFAHDRNTLIGNEATLIPSWYAPAALFFSNGRSQGIQGTYSADQFRVMFGFSDGANQTNTNYNATNEADIAFNIRGEWQAMGAPNWTIWDYDTSFKNQADMALLIGAGLAYQNDGSTGDSVSGVTAPATPFGGASKQNSIHYTIDATLKDAGWHVTGAFLGRHIDGNNGAKNLDDFGWYIQGGVFLADQWELLARLDAIYPDGDYGATQKDSYFLTGGVNYYVVPESHAAIVNLSVTYAFEQTFGPKVGPVDGVAPLGVPGSLSNLSTTNGSVGFLGDGKKGEFGVALTAQVKF